MVISNSSMSYWGKSPGQRLSRQESRGLGMVDVPSDESDPGCSPSKRPRVRKTHFRSRQNSYRQTQKKLVYPGLGDISDKQSSSSSNPSVSPSLAVDDEIPMSRRTSQTNRLSIMEDELIDAANSESFSDSYDFPQPPACQDANDLSKSLRNLNPDGGKQWTIYSIWMPPWDKMLKCTEGVRLPVKSSDLLKKIVGVINNADVFINQDFTQHHLKAMLIKELDQNNSGVHELLAELTATRDNIGLSNFRREKIKLKFMDPIVGKLLFSFMSQDDILIILMPCCDSECRDVTLVHLTSRKYNLKLGTLLRGTSDKVNLESTTALHDEYGYYTVLKLNFNNQTEARRIYISHDDEVQASMPKPTTSMEEIDRVDNIANVDEPDVEIVDGVTNRADVTTGLQFNSVVRLFEEGRILPGPLRPKVKKVIASKSSKYQYHRLMELKLELEKLIEDENKNNVKKALPCELINHRCTYGIVNSVIKDHRFETAYVIRISDDSLDASKSVLVRLCRMDVNVKGPQIQIGDIIRLHRMTVQIEWDSVVESNTMVLSTSQHQNYLIFRQKPEDESIFQYFTCAYSITLSDYDSKRVEELHAHKLSKSTKSTRENEVERIDPPVDHQNHVELTALHTAPSKRNRDSDVRESPLRCEKRIRDQVSPVVSSNQSTDDASSFVTALSVTPTQTPIEAIDGCPSPGIEKMDTTPTPHVDQPTHLTGESVSQLLTGSSCETKTYTCFMNLAKNSTRPTLMCKITGLSYNPDKKIWYLIISCGEQTLPSKDFVNEEYNFLERSKTNLVVEIGNPKKLVERGLCNQLSDSCNTEDVYIIENVKVTGRKPPYRLEVDGASCIIRFATYEDITGAGENLTFTSSGSNDLPVDTTSKLDVSQPRPTDSEEFNPDHTPRSRSSTNSADKTVTIEHGASKPTPNKPAEGDEPVYVSIVKVKADTPSTASDANPTITRSKSKMKSPGKTENTTLESWTGRPTRRRRPRKHYQLEDSMKY